MNKFRTANNFYLLTLLSAVLLLQSCGKDPDFSAVAKDATTSADSTGQPTSAGSNSVRIRLDSESFMQIDDDDLSSGSNICPGDAKKYYKPLALEGVTGAAKLLQETSSDYIDDGSYGNRPSFIHNVSVDLTNANYYGALNAAAVSAGIFTNNTIYQALAAKLKISFDNCSYRYHSRLKSSYCAAFDSPLSQFAGLPNPDTDTETQIITMPYLTTSPYLIPMVNVATTLIESQFRYLPPRTTPKTNSFYKLLDVMTTDTSVTPNVDYYSCADQGLIQSGFPEESRLYVGGVDIDIDRSKLAARENLLMHLVYIPMGKNTDIDGPDYNNTATKPIYDSHSEALFKVHLMSLADASPTISRAIAQPRHLAYSNEINYPKTVASLAVLTRPFGQAREEQLVIPLSMSSEINRIRIERVQGSAVLVEIALYRLGAKL